MLSYLSSLPPPFLRKNYAHAIAKCLHRMERKEKGKLYSTVRTHVFLPLVRTGLLQVIYHPTLKEEGEERRYATTVRIQEKKERTDVNVAFSFSSSSPPAFVCLLNGTCAQSYFFFFFLEKFALSFFSF